MSFTAAPPGRPGPGLEHQSVTLRIYYPQWDGETYPFRGTERRPAIPWNKWIVPRKSLFAQFFQPAIAIKPARLK